jgi:Family of unknown function (DUF6334)
MGGYLVGVTGDFFVDSENGRSFLVSISFNFATSKLVISANEDDSVQVSFQLDPVGKGIVRRELHENPWASLLNTEMIWCWKLSNQFGVWDGIQFQFRSSDIPESISTIQMIVVASELKIRRVIE